MATEQVLAREDLLYPTVILPGALPDFAHYDFYLSIFGNGSGALASMYVRSNEGDDELAVR